MPGMSNRTLTTGQATLARLFNRRLRTVIQPTDLTPIQVTVIYAFLGFGALYLSDVLLPRTVQDEAFLARIQAFKGGVEVALTAGVILALTARSRRAIEKRNQRLDTLRAERTVLHRVFRHNLRQDLTVMLGHVERIRSQSRTESVEESCTRVVERLDRIEHYQDKVVRIERLLKPPIAYRQVDLSEMVREHPKIEELRGSEDVSVSLDLPDDVRVVAIHRIEEALGEVLDNAVAHNDAEEPEVRVAIEENSDELVDLAVTDNGPGIPEYERLAIEGMREENLTHSSGLGLWLAKLACTVSGGDLHIPAQPDGGGQVVIELPEAYDRTIQRRVRGLAG